MELIQQNGIFDFWLQKYYKTGRIDDMNTATDKGNNLIANIDNG